MKRFIVFIITILIPFQSAHAAEQFWKINAVDTMKFSRDISREPDIKTRIPSYVEVVAKLEPTHIAIATPYDEEFYPVLLTWVTEARKHDLKVWFRGNFSGWEGWFDRKRFTDVEEHHVLQAAFIRKHPELFEDGDIFTPAPEPENGGKGDPRFSDEQRRIFLEFLPKSYDTCVAGMKAVKKDVACGYFSTNGDVARQILTKDLVKRIGNVVVIDHYVKTPEQLVKDIRFYHEKYDAPIVLGEIGGPIPDIHGEMNEFEQAQYMQDTFAALLPLGDMVQGINYWTAFGGSTKLFEDKTLFRRRVGDVLYSFFHPPELHGTVSDQYGNKIQATVSALNGAIIRQTNKDGEYTLPLPGKLTTIIVEAGSEFSSTSFELGLSKKIEIRNITLQRTPKSFIERITLSIKGFFSKLASLAG